MPILRFLLAAGLLVPGPAVAAATLPTVCSFNPQAAACAECGVSADVNGDGSVNGADLAVLLGSWGLVPNGGSPADFNQDGTVSCFDQKLLLGNWGPCDEVETDLNSDSHVNLADAGILLDHYGDCSYAVPPCSQHLPLDLDNNGRINQNDVDAVACFFGQPLPDHPDVDFNRNGVADTGDQQIVRDAMGQICPYDLNQNGLVEGTDVRVIIEKGAH